jgi:hypothetical protein
MMITAIVGMLDGFNENPENRITGMFQGMFDNFWNASVRALTFGLYDPVQGGWNKDWQKNYFLAHLIDFIDVVREKGIVAAIENYMTHIFRDEAIRVINQEGGIADFLTGNAEMVKEDGVWIKKIKVTDNEKLYLDPITDNVVGRDYGDVRERGQYGVNPITGGFGLISGSIEEVTSEGTRMVYYVSGSVIIDKMEVYGTDGGHIQIIARDPETGLELNENGIPIGGIVADFERGKLYEYQYIGGNINVEINFDNPNVDISSVMDVDWSNLTNQQKEEVINYYLVMNGIGNQNPYNSPNYMFNFSKKLADADPLRENITLIPLFNDLAPKITNDDLAKVVGDDAPFLMSDLKNLGYVDEYGVLQEKFYGLDDASELLLYPDFWDRREEIYDFLKNFNNNFFSNWNNRLRNVIDWGYNVEKIAQRIYGNLEAKYGDSFPPNMTSVNYSGSGDPFLHLINDKKDIDINSIILVGTPIRGDRQIENQNVKTVVNIFGEKDWIYSNYNMAARSDTDFDGYHLFKDNPMPINEFAIELKGVGHGDYFYDPTNTSITQEVKELRQKASKFIAEVTWRSKDVVELMRFLSLQEERGAIKYEGNRYIVDLQKVVYNE